MNIKIFSKFYKVLEQEEKALFFAALYVYKVITVLLKYRDRTQSYLNIPPSNRFFNYQSLSSDSNTVLATMSDEVASLLQPYIHGHTWTYIHGYCTHFLLDAL
jgi:hypothetical protein